MRPLSSNPKRALSTSMREDRLHETNKTYKLCMIYRDVLADGTKSPGVISSVSVDKRAAIYVVPIDIWESRGIRRSVDALNFNDYEGKKKFAREHVRLVRVDLMGTSISEIESQYIIKVMEPYSQGTSGELVKRGGLKSSVESVPDGQTQAEQLVASLLTNGVFSTAIMAVARARYGTSGAPVQGVPIDPHNKEQFPKPGDKWIGGD